MADNDVHVDIHNRTNHFEFFGESGDKTYEIIGMYILDRDRTIRYIQEVINEYNSKNETEYKFASYTFQQEGT